MPHGIHDIDARIEELLADNPHRELLFPPEPEPGPDISHLLDPEGPLRPSLAGPRDISHLLDPDPVAQAGQTTLSQGINTVGRGIVGGAVDVAGSGLRALGRLSATTPEEADFINKISIFGPDVQPTRPEDIPITHVGEAITRFGRRPDLQPAAGWENSWTNAISRGVGSTLPLVVVGPFGTGMTVSAGMLMGAGEAMDNAIAAGASEDQILKATQLGLPVGATEALPIELLFRAVPIAARGKVLKAVGRVVEQTIAEGGQEAGQQTLQNIIQKYVYNPDQDITEGVLESAAIGAATGGILGTGGELLRWPWSRETAEQPPPDHQPMPEGPPGLPAPPEMLALPPPRTPLEGEILPPEEPPPPGPPSGLIEAPEPPTINAMRAEQDAVAQGLMDAFREKDARDVAEEAGLPGWETMLGEIQAGNDLESAPPIFEDQPEPPDMRPVAPEMMGPLAEGPRPQLTDPALMTGGETLSTDLTGNRQLPQPELTQADVDAIFQELGITQPQQPELPEPQGLPQQPGLPPLPEPGQLPQPPPMTDIGGLTQPGPLPQPLQPTDLTTGGPDAAGIYDDTGQVGEQGDEIRQGPGSGGEDLQFETPGLPVGIGEGGEPPGYAPQPAPEVEETPGGGGLGEPLVEPPPPPPMGPEGEPTYPTTAPTGGPRLPQPGPFYTPEPGPLTEPQPLTEPPEFQGGLQGQPQAEPSIDDMLEGILDEEYGPEPAPTGETGETGETRGETSFSPQETGGTGGPRAEVEQTMEDAGHMPSGDPIIVDGATVGVEQGQAPEDAIEEAVMGEHGSSENPDIPEAIEEVLGPIDTGGELETHFPGTPEDSGEPVQPGGEGAGAGAEAGTSTGGPKAPDAGEAGQAPEEESEREKRIREAAERAKEKDRKKREKEEGLVGLEDAGEKIGGARKDQWAGGLTGEDLGGMTAGERHAYTTKENVWPRPDYSKMVESGVDAKAAYLIKILYDRMGSKPNEDGYSYDNFQEAYIAVVRTIRALAEKAKTVEDVQKINQDAEQYYRDNFKDDIGRDWYAVTWAAGLKRRHSSTRYMPRITYTDLAKAEREVKDGFPNQDAWQRFYKIDHRTGWRDPVTRKWQDGDRWFIYKSSGGRLRMIDPEGGFDNEEAAKAAAKAAYEAAEKGKGGSPWPDRPHLDEVKRIGPDYRQGRNVTSEDFIDTFGFRGVEYGNWVADDERQKIVNLAYDAFMDLARALNMPPKAISLDGTLGIGFGSRGRGGKAAAHYEPSKVVINMTKLKGAGSLAHEWGHALDHYLDGQKPKPDGISGWDRVKGAPSKWELQRRNLPDRLADRASNMMQLLHTQKETKDALRKRLDSQVADAKKYKDQFAQKVRDLKARVDAEEDPAEKERIQNFYKSAVDNFRYFQRSYKAAVEARKNPIEKMRRLVTTEFFSQAEALSGNGDYWKRGNELLARSFEAYIFDRIIAEGNVSQYLVQGVEETRFAAGYRGNPYPAGEERQVINEAYDKLFDVLEATEGKRGANSRIQGKAGPIDEKDKTDTSQNPIDLGPMEGIDGEDTDPVPPEHHKMVENFRDFFLSGQGFKSILDARRFADDHGFGIGPEVTGKQIDEWIEAGVVLAAREIVTSVTAPDRIYDTLVALYEESQPNLSTRTSDSMADQAYSTPIPLAYLVSRLAHVDEAKTIYEPTAGNGALLIEANPREQSVRANEINSVRGDTLRATGFQTTNYDASEPPVAEEGRQEDAVVANPPFGTVKEGAEGRNKQFQVQEWTTTQVDHAIALNALENLNDKGRAVLILGSVNPNLSGAERGKAYNSSQAKREFYWRLYGKYNVIEHFTVSGDLYKKQGASWPVDVIVIDGLGKSIRPLPAIDVPAVFDSWSALKEKFRESLSRQGRERPGRKAKRRKRLEGDREGDQDGAEPGGTLDGERGGDGQPGSLRDDDTEREPADLGEQPAAETEDDELQSEPGGERAGSDQNDTDLDSLLQGILDEEYGTKEAEPAGPKKPSEGSRAPRAPREKASKPEKSEFDEDVLKGIGDIMGWTKQAAAQPPVGQPELDEKKYAGLKPFFTKAAGAAKDAADVGRRLVQALRKAFDLTREQIAEFLPYIKRFITEHTGVGKTAGPKEPTKVPREPAEGGDELQRPYRPKSKKGAIGTLSPTNMGDTIEEALDKLEGRVGPLDEWLAKELGYDVDKIGDYLAAEQIDAAAMALDNVKKGKAFIIGDQTGIGKGRVVASMIRYAMRNGLTPIFVTQKPNLYKDIIRDLNGIDVPGMLGREPRILVTNNSLKIPLDKEALAWWDDMELAEEQGLPKPPERGKFLQAPGSAVLQREMENISNNGIGPDKSYDMIFTTYEQMNTLGEGKEPYRRKFLRRMMANAFLVMDESHTAGGDGSADSPKGKGEVEDRAHFFREAAQKARSVMFSSATYAKRPNVMGLYARTDMGLAVDSPEQLGFLISKGGVPLQQVVAAMLAKAGQYVRRERSFDGVEYNMTPVEVDTKTYEDFSSAIQAIARFDVALKESNWWDEVKNQLAAEAEAALLDPSVGGASVDSTNFSAIMHNLINQMLLSLKANPTADMAIQALKNGEKPVIGLSSTMGSFIKEFAEQEELKKGDRIDLSFKNVIGRYQMRTMRLTVKKPDGEKYHLQVPHNANGGMPDDLTRMWEEAAEAINKLNVDNLPVSPIDWIRYRLEQAGYNPGEITGRSHVMRYSGLNKAVYDERSTRDKSAASRNVSIERFNNEDGSEREIHAVILNRSGSTGLSLHADKDYINKKRRRMIIAQAEGNIDEHMQLLGRIHRTGQVVAPAFDQVFADVPAEARPAAVLARKMASLNANTTASRKSKYSTDDAVDFLNRYGDEVVSGILLGDPSLQIATRLIPNDKGEYPPEIATKFTGRLMLMPLAIQQQVLDDITFTYKGMIDRLDAEGENMLEAKTKDLRAKVVKRDVIRPGTGSSVFQQPAYLDEIEVKAPGRGLKMTEILDRIRSSLRLREMPTDDPVVALRRIVTANGPVSKEVMDQWSEKRQEMLRQDNKVGSQSARDERTRVAAAENKRFREIYQTVMPGNVVHLEFANGPMDGIVMEVRRRESKTPGGNPIALGAWAAEIALPDNTQRIIIPFSSMELPTDPKRPQQQQQPDDQPQVRRRIPISRIGIPNWADLVRRFDAATKEGLEKRHIVTGNILAGYDMTQAKGQIINYTNDKGEINPGILMPRTFKADKFLEGRPVRIRNAEFILQFLDRTNSEVHLAEEMPAQIEFGGWNYIFDFPAAKSTGGKYYLLEGVRKVATFTKRGNRMRFVTSERATAKKVIEAMQAAGAVFEARANQKIAEEITGTKSQAAARPKGWEDVGGETDSPKRGKATLREQQVAEEIVRRVAGNVRTEFKDAIEGATGRSAKDWGREKVEDPGGVTRKRIGKGGRILETVIELALSAHPAVRLKMAYHEAWHAIEQALGKANAKILKAEMDRLRGIAREDYMMSAAEAARLSHTEVLAVAFARYASDKHHGKGVHVGLRKYFKAVEVFLRRLKNAFALRGWKTAEDIFGEAYAGQFAGREQYAAGPQATFEEGSISESVQAAMRPPQQPDPGAVFATPEDERFLTKTMRALTLGMIEKGFNWSLWNRRFGNRAEAMERVEKSIEEGTGTKLPESLKLSMLEKLYAGRTGERLFGFGHRHVKKITGKLNALQRGGMQDVHKKFNDFLYARHAQERNAHLRSIGSTVTDPAGMSDAEARQIIAAAPLEFNAIAGDVYAMLRGARSRLLNSGLIPQDVFDKWDTQYRFYVPLRGFEAAEMDEYMRTGVGYDVSGPEARAALGRRSKADQPLTYAIQQSMQAIIRAEKNRVAQGLHRVASQFRNKEVWSIYKGERRRRINQSTGLIEEYWVAPQAVQMAERSTPKDEQRVFVAKIDGKANYIIVHHEGLRRALRMLNADDMNAVLRFVAPITRVMSKLNTQWSVNFLVSNLLRDLQTALINMTEEQQKGLGKQVVKDMPSAAKAMWNYLNNKPRTTSPMTKWAYEFAENGGKISFFDMDSIERQKKSLEKAVKRGRLGELGRNLVDTLENANSSIENAIRLSTYVQLRKRGYSADKAATVVRDLTVDFNRKGEWSSGFTAAYMFFNAATQGGLKIGRTLVRSRRAQFISFVMLPALGAALSLLNYFLGGDDDDDEMNRWDKVPQYEKDRNLIIMIPGSDAYVKVPLPYGFNAFFVMGQQAMDAVRHYAGWGKGVTVPEAIGNSVTAAVSGFSPIDVLSGQFSTVLPSVVRPLGELVENATWTGAPIYPPKHDPRSPDKDLHFRGVWWGYEAMTELLSDITRFDRSSPRGMVDVSPETVEHLVNTYGGATTSLISGAINNATKMLTGQPPEVRDWPLTRIVAGQINQYVDQNIYYELLNEVLDFRDVLKETKGTDRRELRKDFPEEAKSIDDFERAEKELAGLRRQRRAADKIEDAGRRRARIDKINDRIQAAQAKARRAWERERRKEAAAP